MIRKIFYLAVSCLILGFPIRSNAGVSLQSQHIYASEGGLSSNRVLDITQDSQGFIWMASSNGISRYDGNHFYNIERPIVRYSPRLYSDNRISKICEDKNHLLWMRSRSKELCCYDLTQDLFLNIPFDDEHPNEYEEFLFAPNGDVIARTSNNGVARFCLTPYRTLTVTYYTRETNSLPDNSVRFTIADDNNNIWVGLKHGLSILVDPKSPLAASRPVLTVDTLIYCEAGTMRDGDVWIMGRRGHVFCFDPGNLSKKPVYYNFASILQPELQRINSSAVVGDKWLIVGETNGFEFDFRNQTLKLSKHFNKKKGNLLLDNLGKPYFYDFTSKLYEVPDDLEKEPKLLVTDIYRTNNTVDKEAYKVLRDMDDNLWVSTTASGVFCFVAGSNEVSHFCPGSEANHDLITSSTISCMFQDAQGGIWIGVTRTGICYILPNLKGASRQFVGAEGDWSGVNAICYTGRKGDNILIGNRLGELITYDQDFKVVQRRKFDGNVYDVLNDSHGREWLCTRGSGGLIVDGVSYKKGSGPDDLRSNNVFSAIEDSKGRIWLCTMGGGIALADTKSNPLKFKTYLYNETRSVTMKQMVQGRSDGKIWVSTGAGLFIFDPDELIADSTKYRQYSQHKGNFFVNETNCLWAGTSGSVWVGSLGGGMARCTLVGDSLTYEVYTAENGLVNNEIANIYSDRASGYLWVGAIGGISRFNINTATCDNYYFSREPLGNVYDSRTLAVFPDGRFVEGTYYGMTVIDPSKYSASEKSRRPIISNFTVNGRKLWLHDPHNKMLQQSVSYAREIALSDKQNNLHFEFFVPGFNYKRRYSYWLEGYDEGWSEGSNVPSADFNYLEPGEYVLHVRATNDLGVWTKDGNAIIRISIISPFMNSTTLYIIIGVGVVLLLGGLFFIFRKRLIG